MSELYSRIFNLGLRTANAVARVGFVFFLAKYLEPSAVAQFAIFAVSVTYSTFFVGLDFYTYSSREIIKTPANERGRMLKGQAALSGTLYLIFLPLILFILGHLGWSVETLLWFVPILVLEHLNQEISRLLTALSEQVASSLILLIRQASWGVGSIFLMATDLENRNLGVVFELWAIAGIIALCLGTIKLWHLRTGGWLLRIDWRWVKRGVLVSSSLLLATLAVRGVNTIDRYWISDLGGAEMLAAYVIMQSIASALTLFLESTLFSFLYPKLIVLTHERELKKAHHYVKKAYSSVLISCLLFSLLSILALPHIFQWLDNPAYTRFSYLYPFILLISGLNALGAVSNFGLYARGENNHIVFSSIGSLVVFSGTTYVLSGLLSGLAVIAGLVAAMSCSFLWQTAAYSLVVRRERLQV